MCCRMVFAYLTMRELMVGTCDIDGITRTCQNIGHIVLIIETAWSYSIGGKRVQTGESDPMCYGTPWCIRKTTVQTVGSVEVGQCKALILYNFNDPIICRQL